MLAMEDDRWMVTLHRYLGERPPTDPDGFVAFAAGLPAPDVFEVISDAEPLGEVLSAHFPPACGAAMSGWAGSRTAIW